MQIRNIELNNNNNNNKTFWTFFRYYEIMLVIYLLFVLRAKAYEWCLLNLYKCCIDE